MSVVVYLRHERKVIIEDRENSFVSLRQTRSMALSDFLLNLRIGARLQKPARVTADPKRFDATVMERQIAAADLWLTPRVVDEFDSNDFPNLHSEQRKALVKAIAHFRDVASSVPPNRPVSPEQFREGLKAFDAILTILGPYIRDPEAEQVLEILTTMQLPPFVLGLYCESSLDSTGDEVFRLSVIVTDNAISSPDFWHQTRELRARIQSKLEAEEIDKRVHVGFLTKSEHLEALVSSES